MEVLNTFPGTDQTLVSFVVRTRPDQQIIDMEKFSDELTFAHCAENMTLRFRSEATFQAVIQSWNWVNSNDARSFVIVGEPDNCNSGDIRDPWLVSQASFDTNTLTAYLDATLKTWGEVADSYTLEFGNMVSPSRKRYLEASLEGAFHVDLGSKWPSSLIDKGNDIFKFTADCVTCGTQGTLSFGGHIEGNSRDGITKVAVSATPRGVRADVNLDIILSGAYHFLGTEEFATNSWELIRIPLPAGWVIPRLITVGPTAGVNVGYSLESIEGEAKLSTGMSAIIPEGSSAEINLYSTPRFSHSGWIPEFEFKPVRVEAEVTAKAKIWIEIVTSASLLVFGW